MVFFSDKQRKAFFYRVGQMANPKSFHGSYSEFNKKTDSDMYSELKRRLSESPSKLYEETDRDFKKGYPTKLKDIALTDKTMDMKHSWFGADRPYDEFYFETVANKSKEKANFSRSNRFANEPIGESYIDVDIDPVKYNTGIIVEGAIAKYNQNRLYFDKYNISLDDVILIDLAKNNLLNESESNVSVGQAT